VPIVVTGAPVIGAVVIISQPTATASPTATATVTLTPTVTNTPIPSIFYVSMNVITSTSGPVSIHITYPQTGSYQMKIYNSTGEFIKNLAPPVISASNGQDLWFTWDGTNSLGQKCASGIYVIYYQSPLTAKEAKILLLR
jgi:flagellar hook assembly protein FlgD